VNNIERSRVSFSVDDDSNSTQVTTSRAHDKGSNFEFQNLGDFSGGEIEFNAIVGLDVRVGVSNSSTVVERGIRNALDSLVDFSDSAEFELGFFCINGVDGESSLGIIQKSEVFIGFFDGDDIHETSWVSWFSSNFSVNFNSSLFHDVFDFLFGQGVFQSVSQKEDERKRFSISMRTRDGLGGKDTAQFIEIQ